MSWGKRGLVVAESVGLSLRGIASSRTVQGLIGVMGLALALAAYLQEPVAGAVVFAALLLSAVAWAVFMGWRRVRIGNSFALDEYVAEWILSEPHGFNAEYVRRLDVRILRDNTYAMRHQVWGDGVISPARASPGKVCDEYSDDEGRRTVVVSMGEVKHRGDTGTYTVSHDLEGVFAEDPCFVQVEALADTHRLEIRVLFPRGRPPTAVTFNRQRAPHRRESLPVKGRPDGRQEVSKVVHSPSRNELLTVRWRWPAPGGS